MTQTISCFQVFAENATSTNITVDGIPITITTNNSHAVCNKSSVDRDMIDACGFNKTNNTDCPRITEDEKMFLDHFRFWIGGVVTCCVAITGKNQISVF